MDGWKNICAAIAFGGCAFRLDVAPLLKLNERLLWRRAKLLTDHYDAGSDVLAVLKTRLSDRGC